MVMARLFVPDAGDIVWLELSPQTESEQASNCSALVISPAAFNSKTGSMLCCPMTTQIKGYPFEVIIHAAGVSGAVLSDQVRNFDWRERKAMPEGRATFEEMNEVLAKISSLLGVSRIPA
jgi:mRNA interferase MazF